MPTTSATAARPTPISLPTTTGPARQPASPATGTLDSGGGSRSVSIAESESVERPQVVIHAPQAAPATALRQRQVEARPARSFAMDLVCRALGRVSLTALAGAVGIGLPAWGLVLSDEASRDPDTQLQGEQMFNLSALLLTLGVPTFISMSAWTYRAIREVVEDMLEAAAQNEGGAAATAPRPEAATPEPATPAAAAAASPTPEPAAPQALVPIEV